MKIIISRGEQTFGPYSRDQAKGFLESGELLSSDLASREGDEEWAPLESLLSALTGPEGKASPEEEEELDDFDHEKMKQWEDVFVDDDEEEAASDSNQFIDDDFPDEEEASAPPPVQEEQAQSVPPPVPEATVVPEAPSVVTEQAPLDPLPVEAVSSAPEVEQGVVEEPAPPPPPPTKKGKLKKKSSSKKDSDDDYSQAITPRSKKIKGLNRRQTVIVVKGQSVFSKIYTTSLIFLILFIITCLIAIGGLFFSYESVAPVLKGMGLPSGIIETFEPQKQTSGIEGDENGFVFYSAYCPDLSSQKIKPRGG